MPDTAIDLMSRIDEHHRAVLEVLPVGLLDVSDIDATRAAFAEFFDAKPELPAGVVTEDVEVPGLDGDPDVLVRVYRPADLGANAPALYWIHGGGMILGSIAMNDVECAERALRHRCVVASVEYRLAPEHRFPAPIHDCYAGLAWLAENAEARGIDPSRIAIGGASAGGGLAAGTALMARDKGGPAISFQFLVYPMVDHRNITPSSHAIHDARVWHRQANIDGWAAYLGDTSPDEVSPYASPSLATDLAGLPAAYINVGDLDMFVDEDIAYAQALRQAGVAAELHIYPGAFHGSNGFVGHSPLGQRWAADENLALDAALNPEGSERA